jgi:hypothetical protein
MTKKRTVSNNPYIQKQGANSRARQHANRDLRPPEQSPADRLRRTAMSMLREIVRQYPDEAVQVVRELVPER